METVVLKVSVRELVGFALRAGDLGQHQYGNVSALEGIQGHQKVQASRGEGYRAEVAVRHQHEEDGFVLDIGGRIDGVFEKDWPLKIEEIKTTRRPFDEVAPVAEALHYGQGTLYAYLYCLEHGRRDVQVQVTYLNVDTLKMDERIQDYSFDQLEDFYRDVVGLYLAHARALYEWRATRDSSLAELPFPFDDYRDGQRKMAIAVYRGLRDGKRLFAQAPTGIGKSAATMYPALKAMGEGHVDKVFYLTAKGSGAETAVKTLEMMRKRGLKLKSVVIRAKDKMCVNAPCNPLLCEYALGYYDRLKEGIKAFFEEDHFDSEGIQTLAEVYKLCPFEFSLDLSTHADLMICDYNYAFDPGAYLRRHFGEEKSDHALLVDEAHNLVDRSRGMYSASVSKEALLSLHRALKYEVPKLMSATNSVNRAMLKIRKDMEEKDEEERVGYEPPEELLPAMMGFCARYDRWVAEEQPENVLPQLRETYLEVRRFMRCFDYFDSRFAVIYRRRDKELNILIQCLDASHLLDKFLEVNKGTVFFSATLSPYGYYSRLLAGEQTSPRMALASPFPHENLCLMVADRISTRYKDRQKTAAEVAGMIAAVAEAKEGNYLVFFPSYRYLQDIADVYFAGPGVSLILQERGMDDAAREAFLERFREQGQGTLVGFAVMGGSFGEGVDLAGDALIGVVVVGVGLPMVCTERELMVNFHKHHGEPGFAFAYQFPGMNRVLQTAGRVIRTETDRGVVCLIDDRFGQSRYRALFPEHWQARFIGNAGDVRRELTGFWQQN